MFTYFKMKKNEWKVKAAFYGVIASIFDNQKPIIAMVQTLFTELKDVPAEELRSELIEKIAELVHEDGNNTNEE